MAMKTIALRRHLLPVIASALAFLAAGITPANASRTARISAEVNSAQLTLLTGSQHPLAQAKYESGRLAAATKLQGISLYFSRTAQQQADLDALLAAQQNPASPQFHKWLTPEQYASRFGMADSDLAKVQTWLEQQGFAVDSMSRGKDMIRFSGTVRQVESAFATEMHNYTLPIGGKTETHMAPSTALSVPAAMGSVVLGVRGLDDFRPKPKVRLPSNRNGQTGAKPAFTSGQTGSIFISPGDITTIYDVKPLLSAGIDGTGQTIAIMGQSAVALSDIEAFQSAAGLTVKDPTTLLVPGTGTSTIYTQDEGESDLDLEWAGAAAPGAQILFVYVGSGQNVSVFDSAQYTVDNALAPIISFSYGECEFDLGSANATTLEAITSRAASQGQTLLAASGDSGSTACYGTTSDTTAQQEALNVDYPASSPYVTGVGGTEFNEGSGTYWSSNGSNDVITSALSYIPEMVWNDDTSTNGLAATGGGVSTLFSKPSWQTGVAGIPSDGKRDVPDISLDASNDHDSYLYCTSDATSWSSGQVGSCTSGFRDASTGLLTTAGGTSFSTPIFAGMVALINQKQNYVTGSGLLNPTLYTLAADATTYASAFHDITTGNNKCTAGSTYCTSSQVGYSATTGYDLATGLGSVDLANLAGVWPVSTSTLIGTTTTVTASTTAPAVGANVTYAIAVAPSTGSTVASGTVTLKLDDTSVGTKTLTDGAASYTTSFSTVGAHVLVVAYSGDATHATSTGTAMVTVSTPSSGSGTFTLSATNITVARGSAGTSTITVTPKSGYTGTVQFSLSTTSTDIQNDTCFVLNNATVSGTAAVTESLTIDTSAANCLATGAVRKGQQRMTRVSNTTAGLSGTRGQVAAAAIFAGLLMAGFLGRYSRKLRVLAGVIVLATLGVALSGCGGSSNSVSNAPKGTYTLTLTGTDSSSATITATTTFTLTIN
jgi:subtilase family serine protease